MRSGLDQPAGHSTHFEQVNLDLGGVHCEVLVTPTDVVLAERARQDDDFLLVARERNNGWIRNWLLLLEFKGDVAERVSTVLLVVPEKHATVLTETRPKMRTFILL
jgi:hypothetical protein